jgi:hypothetical protein
MMKRMMKDLYEECVMTCFVPPELFDDGADKIDQTWQLSSKNKQTKQRVCKGELLCVHDMPVEPTIGHKVL